jgi:hypothetical protein
VTKTGHVFIITHQDSYKTEANAYKECNGLRKEERSPKVLETHKIISCILLIDTQNSFIRRGINKSEYVKEVQSDKKKRESMWATRRRSLDYNKMEWTKKDPSTYRGKRHVW